MSAAGLKVDGLVSGYGETVVLDGLSFEIASGGTLAVLGRNGVGKTTLLTTLMGITTRHAGRIFVGDTEVERMPTHRRAQLGLGYVPQEREIFTSLTVEENLLVSVLPGGWDLEKVYTLFPRLKERRRNTGNRLSGGEQQMLAVARALVGGPKVLLLDEPLEGLAPIVIESLFDTLVKIRNETGVTVILIEQKAELALSFASDCIVIDRGKIVHRGPSKVLMEDAALQARLLGVSGHEI
jgi:branched-chain amino acid transport system ATP-binding protein